MCIDQKFTENASEEALTHVLVHEGTHLEAAKKGNGERVQSLEWEEAITELSTAEKLNTTPIAYHDYIRQFRSSVQKTCSSKKELIKAYRNGDIHTINNAFSQSQEQVS